MKNKKLDEAKKKAEKQVKEITERLNKEGKQLTVEVMIEEVKKRMKGIYGTPNKS